MAVHRGFLTTVGTPKETDRELEETYLCKVVKIKSNSKVINKFVFLNLELSVFRLFPHYTEDTVQVQTLKTPRHFKMIVKA